MCVNVKAINKKKKVLEEFGVSKELVQQLFEGKEFVSLRALDCFADSVLRNKFREEEAEKKGRKVG